MNKKLYVGNLSYDTTEADLQTLFAQVAPVASAVIITDRMSGRSKGFGFVEMETVEGAQQAIEQLHNHQFMDRNLTVNEARPQTERPFGGGGGGGGGRFNNDRGGSSGGGWGGGSGGGDRRGGGNRGGNRTGGKRRSY